MTASTESKFQAHTDWVRDQLLTVLLSADDYISGEQLCQLTGVTRTAVWKHIHQLEALGFQIDKRHGVGYRVTGCPDLLLGPLLSRTLHHLSIGWPVVWKRTTCSTNEDAAILASQGAEHGTIVTALEQAGGKGRGGKPWSSPLGGLWQSIIVRRNIPLQRAAELTLMTSVAVRRALVQLTGLPITIKWPNDLLCHGRKLCGILVEIHSEGEWVSHSVIGIGLNTNITEDQIPIELRDTATSVSIEWGQPISHLGLERELLVQLDSMLSLLSPNELGFAAVSEEWRMASSTLGKHIRVRTGNQIVEGYALDFDDSGVLLLQTEHGITRVLSGDVLF